MCGVLSGSARFTERLTLGYRDAVATSRLVAARRRVTRVVGHEFHRTAVTFAETYEPAWAFRRRHARTPCADGAVHAGVHAGYLHTHAAAHPRRGDPLRGRGGNL